MPSTSLPTWTVYALGFGSPGLTFASAVWAQRVALRTSDELERRSRREEVMRSLRWAAELAVDEDQRRSELGMAELAALADSALVDDVGQRFVDVALESVTRLTERG